MPKTTEENKKAVREEKRFGIMDHHTAEALRELAIEKYLIIAEETDRLLKKRKSPRKLQL